MTRRTHRLLGLSALSSLLLGPVTPDLTEAAGPKYYSIYCRGGASGQTELETSKSGFWYQKQFLHGDAPYDRSTLAPSTCTWPDRALRPEEPRTLVYTHTFRKGERLTIRSKMQLVLRGIRGGTRRQQELHSALSAINKLQDPNFIIEFRVRAETVPDTDEDGNVRQLKILHATEVGMVQQVGASNQG